MKNTIIFSTIFLTMILSGCMDEKRGIATDFSEDGTVVSVDITGDGFPDYMGIKANDYEIIYVGDSVIMQIPGGKINYVTKIVP